MSNTKTKVLVEGAAMVALSTVLSFIPIFKLPWGGSVTLLSMLPMVLFSIRRGVRAALPASLTYALIQLFQGIARDGLLGWGLTPGLLTGCIFLDYLLPFTLLGLAGLFRKKKLPGWVGGITLVITLRFLSHVLSGIVIFHSAGMLWESFSTDNSVLYSILYNGCYMLPELIFTLAGAVALLKAPQTSRLLLREE